MSALTTTFAFTSVVLLVPYITGIRNVTRECGQLLSVDDFQNYARENLPSRNFRYIELFAGNGDTIRWNREAFRRIRFRPRLMVDVSERNLATTVLGQEVAFPVGTCPAAAHKKAHPDGEKATARACATTGTLMLHSVWSSESMEEVAAAGGSNLIFWQEVELFTHRNLTLDLVRRAERAGAKAIVLCIDEQVSGIRYATEKDINRGPTFSMNFQGNFVKYGEENPTHDLAVSWMDLSWITNNTKLPVVVKGILTTGDALEAIKHGAKGIIVSNHGGRQLDGSPPTIDVLPEIVRSVNGSVEVYLDSGVRTGMDVLKALSYGARAVFIGRPLLYGLSYKGEIGLKCVLEILRDELDNVMTLTGVTDVKKINTRTVWKGASCFPPNTGEFFSAAEPDQA